MATDMKRMAVIVPSKTTSKSSKLMANSGGLLKRFMGVVGRLVGPFSSGCIRQEVASLKKRPKESLSVFNESNSTCER